MATDYGKILDTGVTIHAQPVERFGANPAAVALEAIAQGIGVFSQDRENRARAKQQAAANARLAEQDRIKALDRNAAGDTAYRAMLINQGIDPVMQPADAGRQDPFGESVTDFEKIFGVGRTEETLTNEEKALQKDSVAAAQKIKDYDNAIEQGTLPGLSKDAAIDMVMLDLVNKYGTEAAPVIIKTMQEAGLTGGVLNEAKRDVGLRERDETAQDKAFAAAYEIGAANLTLEERADLTDQQVVGFGAKIQAAEQQQERLKQSLELERLGGQITREATEFEQAQAARDMRTASNEVLQAHLAPLLTSFFKLQELAGAPGADPALGQRLANSQNLLEQKAATIINNQIARLNIQDPEAARAVREDMETYVSTLLAPVKNRNEAYTTALKAFENRLGIEAAVAMPVVSQLNAAGLRIDAIPALMQVVSEDPALLNRLKTEIVSLGRAQENGGFNATSAKIQVAEIISLMNGNEQLQNFSPDKAKYYVDKLYKVTKALAPDIATGNFDNSDEYMNSLGVVITATNSINRSSGAVANMNAAYAISGSPQTKRALERLMANPDTQDEARVLGIGMRAAATKLSINIRRLAEGRTANHYSVAFRDGKYVATFNRAAWENSRKAATGFLGIAGLAGTSASPPPMPASIKGFVKIANDTITFLTDTNDWEKDSVKGTNRELREFYGQGRMTSAMRKEQQAQTKAASASRAERERAFNTFDEQVASAGSFELDAPSAPTPATINQTSRTMASAATNLGYSPEVAAGILANVQHESGFNPSGVGDSGTAFGYFQHRADRVENFQRVTGVHPKNASPEQAIEFFDWEMKNPKAAGMTQAQVNAIRNAKTAEEAAMLIQRHYERPANVNPARGGTATSFYEGLFR